MRLDALSLLLEEFRASRVFGSDEAVEDLVSKDVAGTRELKSIKNYFSFAILIIYPSNSII